jgi:hypothetical protein
MFFRINTHTGVPNIPLLPGNRNRIGVLGLKFGDVCSFLPYSPGGYGNIVQSQYCLVIRGQLS